MAVNRPHYFQITVRADSAKEARLILDEAIADPDVMTIKKGLPELWGATEVGEYLGIAYQNLYRLSAVGLPEPAIVLNRGRIWLADDIRAFAAQRARSKVAKNWMKGKAKV